MQLISNIVSYLDSIAPPQLQESYDNAGLLTGDLNWECRGVICTLDVTEEVIEEAIRQNINLVIAHHPVIFRGLKKLTGSSYVERTIIKAVKNDIAIFAIHTNLDNIIGGVNGRIADLLGLNDRKVLAPFEGNFLKLVIYVPNAQLNQVGDAIFAAGAGTIGNYSECSFSVTGFGTYKGNEKANPFAGSPGMRHEEPETRFEVILPAELQKKVVAALLEAHPYEEVAYDLVPLKNTHYGLGAGLVGTLDPALDEPDFLALLKRQFGLSVIRHTPLTGRLIQSVAVCGGAGSFLLPRAKAAGAQVYITADMKYHEFFDVEGELLLCDIGHYESEQFTVDLLKEVLEEKFPTFAVLKSAVKTNPVHYYLG
ncbi:MAG TPA: Nif3-like dinuclear metal center hexameric protein [Flavitalea sp.]|nr:Nif3-like dinuclear metal center hexameric protein [Flavitalea sp.]